jgi:hypothetical protein
VTQNFTRSQAAYLAAQTHSLKEFAMITHPYYSEAKEEFDQAWQNPHHTPIELEAIDADDQLQKYYFTSEPFRLTKPMLWDAEAKKAWDPRTYIPRIVREGKSWGRQTWEDGEECFQRASQQRAWLADTYGQVLEEVYLSRKEQSILFLGRAEFLGDDGRPLHAGSHQPLFHVEHAVGGTDSRPLNLWRIVHLTPEKEDALMKRQSDYAEVLREFVAIYVQKDLGIKLNRREVAGVAKGV